LSQENCSKVLIDGLVSRIKMMRVDGHGVISAFSVFAIHPLYCLSY